MAHRRPLPALRIGKCEDGRGHHLSGGPGHPGQDVAQEVPLIPNSANDQSASLDQAEGPEDLLGGRLVGAGSASIVIRSCKDRDSRSRLATTKVSPGRMKSNALASSSRGSSLPDLAVGEYAQAARPAERLELPVEVLVPSAHPSVPVGMRSFRHGFLNSPCRRLVGPVGPVLKTLFIWRDGRSLAHCAGSPYQGFFDRLRSSLSNTGLKANEPQSKP